MDENFAKSSLARTRILSLLNKTLKIYISNLARNRAISKGGQVIGKTSAESAQIKAQNEKFLSYLDAYISEFWAMNRNKKEQEITENELERTAEILKRINKESL